MFDAETYTEKKESWRDMKAENFLTAVKSLLNDDVFAEEIASALAFDYVNRSKDDSTEMFDTMKLDDSDAFCWLDYRTHTYKNEVEDEFREAFID